MRAATRARPCAPRQRGFTLIELLVASALLAILAVIGWRGLDAVLSSRDRIVERSDALLALSVTFSQMDEDLRRSWPVRLLNVPLPTLAFRGTDATPVLELLREGGGASDPSRIERVAYRLRDGLFERGFGPLLAAPGDGSVLGSGSGGAFGSAGGAGMGGLADPAASSGTLPLSNAPLIWQPLLTDVVAVRYRGWVAQRGWGEAATLAAMQATQASQAAQLAAGAAGGASAAAAAAASAAAAVQQITGIEVVIVRGNGERYMRVFPVQD